MVGDYPFGVAKESDTRYKNLYKKNPFIFWNKHSMAKKKISKGLISDDFIDLITRMLMPNPKDRIDISEIKEHAWFQDSAMDESEVKAYFSSIKKPS